MSPWPFLNRPVLFHKFFLPNSSLRLCVASPCQVKQMQLIGLLSWTKTTTKNNQKTTACTADTAMPQEAEMVPWLSPKNRIMLGQKKDQQVEMLPLKLLCVAGEFYKDSPHQSLKYSQGITSSPALLQTPHHAAATTALPPRAALWSQLSRFILR